MIPIFNRVMWCEVVLWKRRTINLDPFSFHSSSCCVAAAAASFLSSSPSLKVFRKPSYFMKLKQLSTVYIVTVWIRIFKCLLSPCSAPRKYSEQSFCGSNKTIQPDEKESNMAFVCALCTGWFGNVCEYLNGLHICAIANAHMSRVNLIYGNTATRTMVIRPFV